MSEIGSLMNVYKQLADSSSTIRWSIYAAGIAGGMDILHNGWLAARWVFKFLVTKIGSLLSHFAQPRKKPDHKAGSR